ncbi:MAG: hypothetical protein J5806_11360 [Lentisphaeria bacterium]|nr:hypothetical protein [Lentisphaeria bacterium]
MNNKRSFSQNKWLIVTVIVLLSLSILVIGTKIAVEHFVAKQLCLIGTELTGRDVEFDSVNYNMLFWDLNISNLKIKNPAGYSQQNPAIEIKRINIKIAPWAMMRRLVHIRELHMEGVSLYPEIKKVPVSSSEWISLVMNPEINLVDFTPKAALAKEARKSALWYLQINDFKAVDAEVVFVNLRKLKQSLPGKLQDCLPDRVKLKPCQQTDLGADGQHNGAMIGREILNWHIADLMSWYDQKKTEFGEQIKNLGNDPEGT